MNKSILPTPIEKFLRFFFREDLIDTLLGDLEELYQRRIEKFGQRKAYRLLLWDALLFFRPFAFKKNIIHPIIPAMLANNLKLSFRKARKYHTSTTTRIVSLTVGIVSAFFYLPLHPS